MTNAEVFHGCCRPPSHFFHEKNNSVVRFVFTKLLASLFFRFVFIYFFGISFCNGTNSCAGAYNLFVHRNSLLCSDEYHAKHVILLRYLIKGACKFNASCWWWVIGRIAGTLSILYKRQAAVLSKSGLTLP